MWETECEIGAIKLKYKGNSPQYIKTKFKPSTMKVYRNNGGVVPAKSKVEAEKLKNLTNFNDFFS
jgi:hypothetical protein